VFPDRLRLALSFRAGARSYRLAAGAVERLELTWLPYGFEAEVAFFVSSETEDDAIVEPFTGRDPIEIELSLASCVLDGTGAEPDPVVLGGVVVERAVREEPGVDVAGAPVVGRRYRARFVDPAAALWKQHHPLELHADASMREVLERHKARGIELRYEWPRLDERRPVICVAAGLGGPASFYDFVAWFLDREGGLLEFAAGAYRLAPDKQSPSAPFALDREFVASLAIAAPEPPRWSGRVLNADAEVPAPLALANASAIAGTRADALVRTPLAERADRRRAIEAGRLRTPEHGLEIDFARLPPRLTGPGAFLTLGEGFSDARYASRSVYRVTRLRLGVSPIDLGEVPAADDETKAFQVSFALSLELASDPRPTLPPYAAPRYPVLVEGTIVSDGGGPTDRTWMSLQAQEGAQYLVNVPLWGKQVPAPFEPTQLTGHWFVPAYKGQRVLVALDFGKATLQAFLDWAEGARAPAEGQGNRLVLGRSTVDGTATEHAYRDGQPALSVRRAFGNDHQALEISEGRVFLEVKEDPSEAKLEPRYDVSPVVSGAKEQLAGEVRSAVEGLNGAFEGAEAGAKASVEGALGELGAAVAEAQASLSASIESAGAELQALSAELSSATQPINQALAEAKAALQAALS
jgi:hypothetical protein